MREKGRRMEEEKEKGKKKKWKMFRLLVVYEMFLLFSAYFLSFSHFIIIFFSSISQKSSLYYSWWGFVIVEVFFFFSFSYISSCFKYFKGLTHGMIIYPFYFSNHFYNNLYISHTCTFSSCKSQIKTKYSCRLGHDHIQ